MKHRQRLYPLTGNVADTGYGIISDPWEVHGPTIQVNYANNYLLKLTSYDSEFASQRLHVGRQFNIVWVKLVTTSAAVLIIFKMHQSLMNVVAIYMNKQDLTLF